MDTLQIIDVKPEHHDWIISLLKNRWGSNRIVSRGTLYHADSLPEYIAILEGKYVGLLTYSLENHECEIISLDSVVERKGIGTRLIQAVLEKAKAEKSKRVWLITTNDNTDALKFYQKRGFSLSAIYPNAIEQSRKLKPEIPVIGMNGIPIKDEIELEIKLSS